MNKLFDIFFDSTFHYRNAIIGALIALPITYIIGDILYNPTLAIIGWLITCILLALIIMIVFVYGTLKLHR